MSSKISSIKDDKGKNLSSNKKTVSLTDASANSTVAEFICACDDLMRSACRKLSFYKEHEGKRYCVLHYPSKEKSEDFYIALRRKLDMKDFDFRGVWFPSLVDFNDYKFTGDANFNSAIFTTDAYFVSTVFSAAADFTLTNFNGTVYFNGATFSAADFTSASFNVTADFISTTFSAYAYFFSATFNGDADFTSAIFNAETSFRSTAFLKTVLFVKSIYKKESTTYFALARFSGVVNFQECIFEASFPFNFDGAIFEKPERVIFHTVSLCPRWFINIDPRKFNFVNVMWGKLNKKAIKSELQFLWKKEVPTHHRLLALAYRQLAVNSEDNNRYSEAADLRYATMLTRSLEIRQTFRLKQLRKIWQVIDPLHSLYGFVSGYGESIRRAVIVLIGIWLVFAAGYWLGDMTWWQQKVDKFSATQPLSIQAQASPPPQTLSFSDALIYSGGIMILQKPEPQPLNKPAKIMVLLETIMGPLQAALLALAIRRKFMR